MPSSRPNDAISYNVHNCVLTLSSVFACCGQETVVQASIVAARRAEDKLAFDFRNLVALALYHVGDGGKVVLQLSPFLFGTFPGVKLAACHFTSACCSVPVYATSGLAAGVDHCHD